MVLTKMSGQPSLHFSKNNPQTSVTCSKVYWPGAFLNVTQGARQRFNLGICSQDHHSSGEGTGKVSSLCSQGVTREGTLPLHTFHCSKTSHIANLSLRLAEIAALPPAQKAKKLTYLLNSDNQHTFLKQLCQGCLQSTSL